MRSAAVVFGDVDSVSLKNLFYLLDKGQARQLASDVNLAIEELSIVLSLKQSDFEGGKVPGDSGVNVIAEMSIVRWLDPLPAPCVHQSEDFKTVRACQDLPTTG